MGNIMPGLVINIDTSQASQNISTLNNSLNNLGDNAQSTAQETQRLTRQIQGGMGAGAAAQAADQLNQTLGNLRTQSQAGNREIQRLEQRLQSGIGANASSQAIQTMNARLEELRSNSRSSQTEIQRLESALSDLDRAMIDSAGSAQRINDNCPGRCADEATGKINKMSGSMKALGGATALAAGAVAAGVIAMGVAITKVGMEFEDANAQIAASFGITIEEARRFSEVAKDVYGTGLTESITESSEIVIQAFKAIGDVGDESLRKVSESAVLIRETFGADTAETISATKTLMDKFGLSAEQSMDMLTAGFQRGLDRSGDFIESVNEYSTQFSNGGASAEQFFSVLETGLSGGLLGTDKAADAFKEFRVRIQDGSKATSEALGQLGIDSDDLTKKMASGTITAADAFQMVIQRLKETDDQNVMMQAGVGLLGTQFEDLGQDASIALDLTAVKMSDLVGSTETLAAKQETLSVAFSRVWANVKIIANDFFETYGSGMAQMVSAAADFLQEHRQDFITVFQSIQLLFLALQDVAIATWIDIKNRVLYEYTEMQQISIDAVDFLMGGWVHIENAANIAWAGITGAFGDAIKWIIDKFAGVIDGIVGMVNKIPGIELDIDAASLKSAVSNMEGYASAIGKANTQSSEAEKKHKAVIAAMRAQAGTTDDIIAKGKKELQIHNMMIEGVRSEIMERNKVPQAIKKTTKALADVEKAGDKTNKTIKEGIDSHKKVAESAKKSADSQKKELKKLEAEMKKIYSGMSVLSDGVYSHSVAMLKKEREERLTLVNQTVTDYDEAVKAKEAIERSFNAEVLKLQKKVFTEIAKEQQGSIKDYKAYIGKIEKFDQDRYNEAMTQYLKLEGAAIKQAESVLGVERLSAKQREQAVAHLAGVFKQIESGRTEYVKKQSEEREKFEAEYYQKLGLLSDVYYDEQLRKIEDYYDKAAEYGLVGAEEQKQKAIEKLNKDRITAVLEEEKKKTDTQISYMKELYGEQASYSQIAIMEIDKEMLAWREKGVSDVQISALRNKKIADLQSARHEEALKNEIAFYEKIGNTGTEYYQLREQQIDLEVEQWREKGYTEIQIQQMRNAELLKLEQERIDEQLSFYSQIEGYEDEVFDLKVEKINLEMQAHVDAGRDIIAVRELATQRMMELENERLADVKSKIDEEISFYSQIEGKEEEVLNLRIESIRLEAQEAINAGRSMEDARTLMMQNIGDLEAERITAIEESYQEELSFYSQLEEKTSEYYALSAMEINRQADSYIESGRDVVDVERWKFQQMESLRNEFAAGEDASIADQAAAIAELARGTVELHQREAEEIKAKEQVHQEFAEKTKNLELQSLEDQRKAAQSLVKIEENRNDKMTENIQETNSMFGGLFENVMSGWQTLTGQMSQTWGGLMQSITGQSQSGFGGIFGQLQSMISGLSGGGGGGGFFGGLIDTVGGWFGDGDGGGLSGLWEGAKGLFSGEIGMGEIWDKGVDFVGDLWSKGTDFVGDLWSEGEKFVGKLGSVFDGSGGDLVTELGGIFGFGGGSSTGGMLDPVLGMPMGGGGGAINLDSFVNLFEGISNFKDVSVQSVAGLAQSAKGVYDTGKAIYSTIESASSLGEGLSNLTQGFGGASSAIGMVTSAVTKLLGPAKYANDAESAQYIDGLMNFVELIPGVGTAIGGIYKMMRAFTGQTMLDIELQGGTQRIGDAASGDFGHDPINEWLRQKTGMEHSGRAVADAALKAGDWSTFAKASPEVAAYWADPISKQINELLMEKVLGIDIGKIFGWGRIKDRKEGHKDITTGFYDTIEEGSYERLEERGGDEGIGGTVPGLLQAAQAGVWEQIDELMSAMPESYAQEMQTSLEGLTVEIPETYIRHKEVKRYSEKMALRASLAMWEAAEPALEESGQKMVEGLQIDSGLIGTEGVSQINAMRDEILAGFTLDEGLIEALRGHGDTSNVDLKAEIEKASDYADKLTDYASTVQTYEQTFATMLSGISEEWDLEVGHIFDKFNLQLPEVDEVVTETGEIAKKEKDYGTFEAARAEIDQLREVQAQYQTIAQGVDTHSQWIEKVKETQSQYSDISEGISKEIERYRKAEEAGNQEEMRAAEERLQILTTARDVYGSYDETIKASEEEISRLIGIQEEYGTLQEGLASQYQIADESGNAYMEKMYQVNSAFDAHIQVLEEQGFAVEAINEVEALRTEALQKAEAELADQRNEILNQVRAMAGVATEAGETEAGETAYDIETERFQQSMESIQDTLTGMGMTAEESAEFMKLWEVAAKELEQSFVEQRESAIAEAQKLAGKLAIDIGGTTELDAELLGIENRFVELAETVRQAGGTAEEVALVESELAGARAEIETKYGLIRSEILKEASDLAGVELGGGLTALDQEIQQTENRFMTLSESMYEAGGSVEEVNHVMGMLPDAIEEVNKKYQEQREEILGQADVLAGVITDPMNIFSEVATQTNKQFDDMRVSLVDLGAETSEITHLENQRTEAIKEQQQVAVFGDVGSAGQISGLLSEAVNEMVGVAEKRKEIETQMAQAEIEMMSTTSAAHKAALQEEIEGLQASLDTLADTDFETVAGEVNSKLQQSMEDAVQQFTIDRISTQIQEKLLAGPMEALTDAMMGGDLASIQDAYKQIEDIDVTGAIEGVTTLMTSLQTGEDVDWDSLKLNLSLDAEKASESVMEGIVPNDTLVEEVQSDVASKSELLIANYSPEEVQVTEVVGQIDRFKQSMISAYSPQSEGEIITDISVDTPDITEEIPGISDIIDISIDPAIIEQEKARLTAQVSEIVPTEMESAQLSVARDALSEQLDEIVPTDIKSVSDAKDTIEAAFEDVFTSVSPESEAGVMADSLSDSMYDVFRNAADTIYSEAGYTQDEANTAVTDLFTGISDTVFTDGGYATDDAVNTVTDLFGSMTDSLVSGGDMTEQDAMSQIDAVFSAMIDSSNAGSSSAQGVVSSAMSAIYAQFEMAAANVQAMADQAAVDAALALEPVDTAGTEEVGVTTETSDSVQRQVRQQEKDQERASREARQYNRDMAKYREQDRKNAESAAKEASQAAEAAAKKQAENTATLAKFNNTLDDTLGVLTADESAIRDLNTKWDDNIQTLQDAGADSEMITRAQAARSKEIEGVRSESLRKEQESAQQAAQASADLAQKRRQEAAQAMATREAIGRQVSDTLGETTELEQAVRGIGDTWQDNISKLKDANADQKELDRAKLAWDMSVSDKESEFAQKEADAEKQRVDAVMAEAERAGQASLDLREARKQEADEARKTIEAINKVINETLSEQDAYQQKLTEINQKWDDYAVEYADAQSKLMSGMGGGIGELEEKAKGLREQLEGLEKTQAERAFAGATDVSTGGYKQSVEIMLKAVEADINAQKNSALANTRIEQARQKELETAQKAEQERIEAIKKQRTDLLQQAAELSGASEGIPDLQVAVTGTKESFSSLVAELENLEGTTDAQVEGVRAQEGQAVQNTINEFMSGIWQSIGDSFQIQESDVGVEIIEDVSAFQTKKNELEQAFDTWVKSVGDLVDTSQIEQARNLALKSLQKEEVQKIIAESEGILKQYIPEDVDKYQADILNVTESYDKLIERMKETGAGTKKLTKIEEDRDAILSQIEANRAAAVQELAGEAQGIIDSFSTDSLTDYQKSVQNIEKQFTGIIEKAGEVSATEEEIADIRLKQAEAIKAMSEQVLTDIESQVSEYREGFLPTEELSEYQSTIQEVEEQFKSWRVGMEEAGASVERLTNLDRERAGILGSIRSEAVNDVMADIAEFSQAEFGSVEEINQAFGEQAEILADIGQAQSELNEIDLQRLDLIRQFKESQLEIKLQEISEYADSFGFGDVRSEFQKTYDDANEAMWEHISDLRELEASTEQINDVNLQRIDILNQLQQAELAAVGEEMESFKSGFIAPDKSEYQQQIDEVTGTYAGFFDQIADITQVQLSSVDEAMAYLSDSENVAWISGMSEDVDMLIDTVEEMGAVIEEINRQTIETIMTEVSDYAKEFEPEMTWAASVGAQVDEVTMEFDRLESSLLKVEGVTEDTQEVIDLGIAKERALNNIRLAAWEEGLSEMQNISDKYIVEPEMTDAEQFTSAMSEYNQSFQNTVDALLESGMGLAEIQDIYEPIAQAEIDAMMQSRGQQIVQEGLEFKESVIPEKELEGFALFEQQYTDAQEQLQSGYEELVSLFGAGSEIAVDYSAGMTETLTAMTDNFKADILESSAEFAESFVSEDTGLQAEVTDLTDTFDGFAKTLEQVGDAEEELKQVEEDRINSLNYLTDQMKDTILSSGREMLEGISDFQTFSQTFTEEDLAYQKLEGIETPKNLDELQAYTDAQIDAYQHTFDRLADQWGDWQDVEAAAQDALTAFQDFGTEEITTLPEIAGDTVTDVTTYLDGMQDWLGAMSDVREGFASFSGTITEDIAKLEKESTEAGLTSQELIGVREKQIEEGFKALETATPEEALKRAEELRELILEKGDLEKKSLEELTTTAEDFEQVTESIKNKIDELRYSEYNLQYGGEKFEMTQTDYGSLLEQAQTGDAGAISEYMGQVDRYLGESQEMFRSSGAYQEIYEQVMADIASLGDTTEAMAQVQISEEAQRLDALTEVSYETNNQLALLGQYADQQILAIDTQVGTQTAVMESMLGEGGAIRAGIDNTTLAIDQLSLDLQNTLTMTGETIGMMVSGEYFDEEETEETPVSLEAGAIPVSVSESVTESDQTALLQEQVTELKQQNENLKELIKLIAMQQAGGGGNVVIEMDGETLTGKMTKVANDVVYQRDVRGSRAKGRRI